MSEERVKRKLSAILSADVVGYSRLMGEDEVSTVRTLEAYRKVMSDLIEQFRGRVVDSPGDNLLAEFSSVVDAVQCAVEIHEVIRAKNEELPENRRMLFRVGVNLGDVIEEGDRIYGDGVNIAARLEGLADPGGICISGTAHEHIKNKLALGYEYIGEHTVKNITEPLKVYRVPMGPKAAFPKEEDEKKTRLKNWRWTALGAAGGIIVVIGALAIWNFYLRGPSIEPASVERMAYPLPDKPSIAVLPFTNMSGDPEQDYIGDGLSENIISALSVSSQMFVMARNATFTYKGTAVKPQQVAEDLGVQYILEGSIQKSGNQLRVTAQLIDALSGHHLWSEVYDREMRNLFGLQDEITKKIMVSLQVVLSGSEDARVFSKSTDNLEAWKYFIKGKELFENFIEQDNTKAREHFKTALELDPQYVTAMSHLGFTHLFDSLLGWSDSPSDSIDRAFELAQKALELDDQDPLAHGLLGFVPLYQRQHNKAIIEGTRAITLNPNFALGCGILGAIMTYSGQFEEAINMLNKGYRLNPNLDPALLSYMVRSYISMERYNEALEVSNKMEENVLNGRLRGFKCLPPLYSSWIYIELGREEEARAYMREALKRKPDLSLEWYERLSAYKNPAHLQRALGTLRKAGMPEHPPGAVQEKPSIAVLPFDDLSPEKDQEHFVLGLSEEILNSLTHIPDLTVKARTSSFSFKGKNKTIQEIAKILGVDHVLEGSVRKYGNTIRITAQLIKTEDESHLWSETYDKKFKVDEMFSVQENIANNVADKLKLTLEAFQLLGGTENVEAYESYLRARGQFGSGREETLLEGLKLIDDAISRDPNFALAWGWKARTHILLHIYGPSSKSIDEENACIKAAQRAISLEPNLANGYAELGTMKMLKGEWMEAELNFRKSFELTQGLVSSENILITPYYLSVGKFTKASELLREMRKNDPIDPSIGAWYCYTWGLLGKRHLAEEEYERSNEMSLGEYSYFYDRVITAIRLGSGDTLSRDDIVSKDLIDIKLMEYIDSPEKGLFELHRIYNSDKNLSSVSLHSISVWAAYFGDPDLAIDSMEKGARISADIMSFWLPVLKEVRLRPQFRDLMKEIGLVDYWKEYGWPDLCRPVSDDDFVCD